MKTLKQISDELGIDKQKVYRYVLLKHISEVPRDVHQKNGTKYYDESAEMLIKQAFSSESEKGDVHQCTSKVHHDALQSTSELHHDVPKGDLNEALISMLQTELQTKNDQIRQLNERLSEVSAALAAANAALQTAHQSLQAEQALHAGTIQALTAPIVEKSEKENAVSSDPVESPKTESVKKSRFWGFLGKK